MGFTDRNKALELHTLAAKQGHPYSQLSLGMIYQDGEYVTTMHKDYKKAVKWYTLSAGQGVFTAQYKLGVMYKDGLGVIQAYAKAHMWDNIGASNGSLKGKLDRAKIAEQMTPFQIEKAQDLARECVAKNFKGC